MNYRNIFLNFYYKLSVILSATYLDPKLRFPIITKCIFENVFVTYINLSQLINQRSLDTQPHYFSGYGHGSSFPKNENHFSAQLLMVSRFNITQYSLRVENRKDFVNVLELSKRYDN